MDNPMEENYPARTYKCELCEKRFLHMVSMRPHILADHFNIRPYQCTQCDKKFQTKQYLHQHFKKHGGMPRDHFDDVVLRCDFCKKIFSSSAGLVRHLLSEHKDKAIVSNTKVGKLFKCVLCSFEAAKVFTIRDHVRRDHFDHKPFQCQYCNNEYSLYWSLKCHMEEKHGNFAVPSIKSFENKFGVCTICGDNCLTFSKLTEHLLKNHIDEAKNKNSRIDNACETCSMCNFVFQNKTKAARHVIAIHYKMKPWRCEICSEKHVCKETIKKHVLEVHGKPKREAERFINCVCSLCNHNFPQVICLANHLKETHEPLQEDFEIDEGNKCCFCTYLNKSDEAMLSHLLMVHFQKPLWSCSLCTFHARKLEPLKKHYQKHGTEESKPFLEKVGKIFQCPVCEKTFSDFKPLSLHLMSHHKSEAQDRATLRAESEKRGKIQSTSLKVSFLNKIPRIIEPDVLICIYCGKQIPRGEVRRHLHEHLRTSSVLCNLCDDPLSSVEEMNTHLKRNHGKKVVQDVDEKLFEKCPSCDEVFRFEENLLAHMKKKHFAKSDLSNILDNTCGICGEKYVDARLYEFHVKYFHL